MKTANPNPLDFKKLEYLKHWVSKAHLLCVGMDTNIIIVTFIFIAIILTEQAFIITFYIYFMMVSHLQDCTDIM